MGKVFALPLFLPSTTNNCVNATAFPIIMKTHILLLSALSNFVMGSNVMSEKPSESVFTIKKLNARVRAIVEQETVGKMLWVGGIVHGLHKSDYGHIYFSLEDDLYSLRCILRESVQGSIGFSVTNGMEIEAYGSIGVYEQRAQVNLEIEAMQMVKRASLKDYGSVEDQLAKRGLWPKPKKSLPAKPRKIAVVTSRRSEAIEDFRTNYRLSGGTAEIVEVDVRIQGDHAPREISDAIRRLNLEADVDIIVLTRGGGRHADMAVFDDLLIAEAIAQSTIPIVTGIGHEGDTTFADRAADMTTSTPTAVAVMLARLHLEPAQPEKPTTSLSPLIVGLIIIIVVLALTIVYVLASG
jgi:exodeoxyribonuclease VII large subunit